MGNVEEIRDLLERGVRLDTAFTTFCAALGQPPASRKVDGVEYHVDGEKQFSVSVHGLTLLSRYLHVKARSPFSPFPDLYAQIEICMPDSEGRPGEAIVTLLMTTQGAFSLDGTTNVGMSLTNFFNNADYSRERLSLVVAGAVQDRMPNLGKAG